MKRDPSGPSKSCKGLVFFTALLHIITGISVIVFQVLLIIAGSPYHDIGGGLWSGPLFFIQGVLGFVSLCDTLMCSVVSFLISSVLSALLTVGLTAVAAVDLGSIYKCQRDSFRISYEPSYCSDYTAPRIKLAGWGIVASCGVQLLASVCSIYYCIRVIYSTDSGTSRPTTPYLYDEIPSPGETRFRGSLQTVQEKVATFKKSSYSLTSTLPARSKSVDEFSQTESDLVPVYHPRATITSSVHSVSMVPDGLVRKKTVRNAASMHNVGSTRVRSGSVRSVDPEELTGFMKHTAV